MYPLGKKVSQRLLLLLAAVTLHTAVAAEPDEAGSVSDLTGASVSELAVAQF